MQEIYTSGKGTALRVLINILFFSFRKENLEDDLIYTDTQQGDFGHGQTQGGGKEAQSSYVQIMKVELDQKRLCTRSEARSFRDELLTSCPSLRQSGLANCSRVALRTSHGFYTISC